jgi:hypothetical protein
LKSHFSPSFDLITLLTVVYVAVIIPFHIIPRGQVKLCPPYILTDAIYTNRFSRLLKNSAVFDSMNDRFMLHSSA